MNPYENAEKIIQFMRFHNLTPNPSNFGVLYEYFLDNNKVLKGTVDVLINDNKINDVVMTEIADIFINNSSDNLQHVNQEIKLEIQHIANTIQTMSLGNMENQKKTLQLKEVVNAKKEPKQIETVLHEITDIIDSTIDFNKNVDKVFTTMQNKITQLATELEYYSSQANMDALTRIANRRAFDNKIENLFQLKTPFSFILLDIDFFKKFNDTHGHHVGDQVLMLTANFLKKNIKGKDFLARYGGEEFAIILPKTSLDNAYIVADSLRKQLSSKELIKLSDNQSIGIITASFGVSSYDPAQDELFDPVFERADKSLYLAKKSGRNQTKTEKDL